MKCGKVLKKLSLFMDGRLEKETSEKITLHLEMCSGCRSEYRLMKISHESLATLGQAKVPEDLAMRSVRAVTAASANSGVQFTTESKGLLSEFLEFKWPAVVTSATALAAALVIGIVSGVAGDEVRYGSEQDMVDPAAELHAYEEAGLEDDFADDWVLGDGSSGATGRSD